MDLSLFDFFAYLWSAAMILALIYYVGLSTKQADRIDVLENQLAAAVASLPEREPPPLSSNATLTPTGVKQNAAREWVRDHFEDWEYCGTDLWQCDADGRQDATGRPIDCRELVMVKCLDTGQRYCLHHARALA